MTYTVDIDFTGSVSYEVEADNEDEARDKAAAMFDKDVSINVDILYYEDEVNEED